MNETLPQQLAHRLRTSYDRLWETLSLLEPGELEQVELSGGWTPKTVLAHVAYWDDFQCRRMVAAYTGVSAQHGFPHDPVDNDQRALADRDRSWTEVVAAADEARARLVEFAESLPATALTVDYAEGERRLALAGLLEHMVRHTRSHTQELRDYCGSLRRWSIGGLRALLVQNHKDLMDSIGGLREETILHTQVCGHWSIRDVLAHVLSWNEFAYLVLQQWPQPDRSRLNKWLHDDGFTEGRGSDATNQRLLAAQTGLDLITIVDGLATYHRRLLRQYDGLGAAGLCTTGDFCYGESGEAARFFYEFSLHEVEHAEQIWYYRATLGQTL